MKTKKKTVRRLRDYSGPTDIRRKQVSVSRYNRNFNVRIIDVRDYFIPLGVLQ